MIIKGEIPHYYKTEEIENDTRDMFINLESCELEYYTKKMENNPLWVNITSIFKKTVKVRELIKQLEQQ